MTGRGGQWLAVNDVAMHRQPGKRVADLMYGTGMITTTISVGKLVFR